MRAWRWICGVKPKPKAVNKPLHHFIVHGLDKPGNPATVSKCEGLFQRRGKEFLQGLAHLGEPLEPPPQCGQFVQSGLGPTAPIE